MAIYSVNAFSNTCFQNNQTISSVDLHNISFVGNSMSKAFANCYNLQTITNINQNVTNMEGTFHYCTNLVNTPIIPNSVTSMPSTFSSCNSLVNAPVIPNSVTSMVFTFSSCNSLVNAPEIPNSVTNMYSTFSQCDSLLNAPEIPNSVTNMYSTFYGCTNLVNAPIIPNSVTNMFGTFEWCINLSGDIYIKSAIVASAYQCFGSTSLTKNVYIPFEDDKGREVTYYCWSGIGSDGNNHTYYTLTISKYGWDYVVYDENLIDISSNVASTMYDNILYVLDIGDGIDGEYPRDPNNDKKVMVYDTLTYNAFSRAGYSTTTRVNGVLLFDINPHRKYIETNGYEFTNANDMVSLTKYTSSTITVTVPTIQEE